MPMWRIHIKADQREFCTNLFSADIYGIETAINSTARDQKFALADITYIEARRVPSDGKEGEQ